MNEYIKVGKKADFPENRGTGVVVDGKNVCIVRHGDKAFAFDDRCTHAESLLSGGDVEGGEIGCPLHGARFSIATGEPMTLPAVKPVRIHEAKIEGDTVFVRLKE
jgi:3-phenylpropionate/trans-cinnamate dioxygenase ferredoxin component